MKNDAIARREVPRLIRRVLRHGSFEGVRGGHPVTIKLDPAPMFDAPPILYTVATRAAIITDRAPSVYAAVDQINHITKGAARP